MPCNIISLLVFFDEPSNKFQLKKISVIIYEMNILTDWLFGVFRPIGSMQSDNGGKYKFKKSNKNAIDYKSSS